MGGGGLGLWAGAVEGRGDVGVLAAGGVGEVEGPAWVATAGVGDDGGVETAL